MHNIGSHDLAQWASSSPLHNKKVVDKLIMISKIQMRTIAQPTKKEIIMAEQNGWTAEEVKTIQQGLQMLHNSITRSAKKMSDEGRNAIAGAMAEELKRLEKVQLRVSTYLK